MFLWAQHGSTDGKAWRYVLIPHDAMLANATLAGLVAKFTQPEIVDETMAA